MGGAAGSSGRPSHQAQSPDCEREYVAAYPAELIRALRGRQAGVRSVCSGRCARGVLCADWPWLRLILIEYVRLSVGDVRDAARRVTVDSRRLGEPEGSCTLR